MTLMNTRDQNNQGQGSEPVLDSHLETSTQTPGNQWVFAMGIAAVTTLTALPTQAITIGQFKTQVFPYVPKDYSVLDTSTGRYVPLNTTGELTLDEFFILNEDELSSVTDDAQRASDNAFQVTNPTATFDSIGSATTLVGAGRPTYRSVFNIGELNLNDGNTLTIDAKRGESVVLNIFGDLQLYNNAAIELTGGIKVDTVLINVLGNVSLFNDSSVAGTILAVNGNSRTTINGGTVGGTLIANEISLQDAYVDGIYLVPEPFTILGTATALGFGVLLKKESANKLKKEKTKV